MLTVVDISNKLRNFEETMLIELLEISSDDIVDRFQDVIEVNYDMLLAELEAYEGDLNEA